MTEQRITSRANAYLQHVRKLRENRAYRYETREYMADGEKLLLEALRWNVKIQAVVACDGVPLPALPQDVRCIRVPQSLMAELSRMKTPQGVIAVCAMPPGEPLSLCAGSLILDGIQDPGNVGTILRTADALDVPVILTNDCADPYSEKTVRASMGAVLRTTPVQATREQLLEVSSRLQIELCATALRADAKDVRQLPLHRYALIIGSEGQGVCDELLHASAQTAIIPMNERCESMNAAIAAAILMWQMKR